MHQTTLILAILGAATTTLLLTGTLRVHSPSHAALPWLTGANVLLVLSTVAAAWLRIGPLVP